MHQDIDKIKAKRLINDISSIDTLDIVMNEILKLTPIKNIDDIDSVSIDSFWNNGEKELAMHKIHAYPAKFPAFITSKALVYYHQEYGNYPESIADIFCGCGTVALEASRKNIDFWGCDINPVATLIAKTKSSIYNCNSLKRYYRRICADARNNNSHIIPYTEANERIQYWYQPKQYEDLYRLLESIRSNTTKGKYRCFFECAFSNILKPTSRWLTKSIKPQIDPDKVCGDVFYEFEKQFKIMFRANEENLSLNDLKITHKPRIERKNVLTLRERKNKINMIVTSPPYVTSYEYADLHQLSSIWLGYVDDYRVLRNGSIGSDYQNSLSKDRNLKYLNDEGKRIVNALREKDHAKARVVGKYFLDMENVVKVCHKILSENGLLLFVIGDTEYKGVKIKNSNHLAKSLMDQGFEVSATRRKITRKNLTPYRDSRGMFTTDESSRQVYNEEYILIGRKID